jgi:hypothetical protein
MMRRLLACALLLLVAGTSFAADRAPEALQPGEVLRGHFTQERRLAGFARPLKSTGSFVLAPGKGLIWRTETPLADTVVITGNGILQIVNGQEAMRVPAARLPVIGRFYDVLSGALTGDAGALEKVFAVERHADPAQWQLVLSPAGGADPSLAQILSITVTGTALVDTVEIRKPGGDADTLRFDAQARTREGLTSDETELLQKTAR